MSLEAFHGKRKEPDDLVADLLRNVSISPTKKARVGVCFPSDALARDARILCTLCVAVWNFFFFIFFLPWLTYRESPWSCVVTTVSFFVLPG
jgi:hypothetical protein